MQQELPERSLENFLIAFLNVTPLQKKMEMSFNGGGLLSDAGLLLIQDFASKIGFAKAVRYKFPAIFHTILYISVNYISDAENVLKEYFSK